MFRKVTFYDNFTDALTGTWSSFMLQGLLLILLGVLVMIMPQLLVAMVAATFIMLGVIFLAIAFKTRKLRNNYRVWREEFWEPF